MILTNNDYNMIKLRKKIIKRNYEFKSRTI